MSDKENEERVVNESGNYLTTTEDVHIYQKFQDMGLNMEILRAIYSIGFDNPSPIQKRAIVPCYNGRDCIIQAQSGTGKTATFSIAAVQRVLEDFKKDPRHVLRSLVLSPTRELATQSFSVISDLTNHCELVCKAVVGGRSVKENIFDVNEGADIIVGTPGRILHLLGLDHISFTHLSMLILDEADEMLSRGFRDAMNHIISRMPSNGQIVLVSATLPDEILVLSDIFLKDPFKILVNKTELSLSGISQYYVDVSDYETKVDTLKLLYKSISISKAVIFCNSIVSVKKLADALKAEKFPAEGMHGQMDQTERDRVINLFRSQNCRILVSSDLLSRGLDLQHVNLVINFDVPNDRQSYLHRIGRSGRYGRKGTAINFVTNDDKRILSDIKEHYGIEISQLPANLEL